MSNGRRPNRPVGRGYMPKGGAAAAQSHNATALPASRRVAEPVTPEPVTDDARTDARGSGWSAESRTDRLIVVGTSVVASSAVSALVAWLVG